MSRSGSTLCAQVQGHERGGLYEVSDCDSLASWVHSHSLNFTDLYHYFCSILEKWGLDWVKLRFGVMTQLHVQPYEWGKGSVVL